MQEPVLSVESRSPEDTAALAARVGAVLSAGDCLLLEGEIGAGKTHFARHLIQSLMLEPEDVPSPTFTLVQTYDTRSGELWHADLYRLSAPEEIEELGLTEAFETAICIVEWPDRLGDLTPEKELRIRFDVLPGDEFGRQISFGWTGDEAQCHWRNRLEEAINDRP